MCPGDMVGCAYEVPTACLSLTGRRPLPGILVFLLTLLPVDVLLVEDNPVKGTAPMSLPAAIVLVGET